MTALEIMKTLVRLCRSCKNCSQCILGCVRYGACFWTSEDFSPEDFVKNIEQWAKEHPIKSRDAYESEEQAVNS